MIKKELEEKIKVVMDRSDPAYTTPSGAFLELLSVLATELKLDSFAEACKIYTSAYPITFNFIAARVPGILCNRYFTVHSKVDYEKFIQWTINTPNWEYPLKESFTSTVKLKSAVNKIITAVSF